MYPGDYLYPTDPYNPSLSGRRDSSWADSYYRWYSCPPSSKPYYVQAPLSMPSTHGYTDCSKWAWNNMAIWPIILIVIVVYLIWSEYGSQDCRKQNCNNRARMVHAEDTDREIIDKVSDNLMRNHTIVTWRRSIIISIVIALLILILFCKEFPHGFTVLLTVLFVFMAVQISANWFQAHWWLFNDYKIDRSLQELRQRIVYK